MLLVPGGYGVVVSTLDSKSDDPSSNLGSSDKIFIFEELF